MYRFIDTAKRLLTVSLLTLVPCVCIAEVLALVGGTLIDGNGGKPVPNSTIIIDNNRIVAIGDRHLRVPAQAEIINARGKYIIPGLMDANVHLLFGFSTEYMMRFEKRFTDIIAEGAQVALKEGVTTVFDSWGPLEALKTVREQINTQQIPGSRIFFAGNIIGIDGPLSPDFYANTSNASPALLARINAQWEQGTGHELLLMTPEQVQARMDEYLQKGMDFAKVALSGHGPYRSGFLLFSPQVQNIIIGAIREAGLSVQTHTTTIESLRMAVNHRVDLIQHCAQTLIEPIPDALIKELVTARIPCTFNLNTDRFFNQVLGAAKDLDPRSHSNPMFKQLAIADHNQRKLIKAGVIPLLSTDGGVPYPDSPIMESFFPPAYPDMEDDLITFFGRGQRVWLRAAIEKGLTPMQALQAATRNIAAAYGKLEDLGTIEVGKLADMVLLNNNPLEDVRHYADIDQVIKDGRVIDRDALPLAPLFYQSSP